jgi:hypothetical protein
MVQKGKLEETVLEAMPQMAVQIVNSYWSSSPASVITILSITLSSLSLLNTIWFYAYWQFYRCKRTRDVPSPLALYNYKLDGVRDGIYSFTKPQKDVRRAATISFNPTVLPNSSILDNALSKTVVREGEVAIEMMARPLKAVEVGLPPRMAKAGDGGRVIAEVQFSDHEHAADAITAAVAATRAQCQLEAAIERAALQAEISMLKLQQQQVLGLNQQPLLLPPLQNQQQQLLQQSPELQRHLADHQVMVI